MSERTQTTFDYAAGLRGLALVLKPEMATMVREAADALEAQERENAVLKRDMGNIDYLAGVNQELADEIERLRAGIVALAKPYTENASEREHLRGEFAIEFAKELEALLRG